jgi:hypothetical protein
MLASGDALVGRRSSGPLGELFGAGRGTTWGVCGHLIGLVVAEHAVASRGWEASQTREGRCSWLQPVSAASTVWPPGARDAGNGYLASSWTIPKLLWHFGVVAVEGAGRGDRKGESLMLGSWASGGYS